MESEQAAATAVAVPLPHSNDDASRALSSRSVRALPVVVRPVARKASAQTTVAPSAIGTTSSSDAAHSLAHSSGEEQDSSAPSSPCQAPTLILSKKRKRREQDRRMTENTVLQAYVAVRQWRKNVSQGSSNNYKQSAEDLHLCVKTLHHYWKELALGMYYGFPFSSSQMIKMGCLHKWNREQEGTRSKPDSKQLGLIRKLLLAEFGSTA